MSIPSAASTAPRSLRMAMISDIGGPIASSTSFYYNFGSANNFVPTNSFGPGPDAVSGLVRGWSPEQLFAVGDLAYNAGPSTALDPSVGLYYNNYIYPYPSPAYQKDPYLTIAGQAVPQRQKQWPYNIYNFPQGFPSPIDGRLGGSADGRNRFWASLGNHDYGLEVGYAQVGVTPYSISGQDIGAPLGPTSTTSLRSSVDYLLPFLENPSLLGADQTRLNVGSVDKEGNRGVYYSIKLGGSADNPLVEVFQLDSERLNVNAGYEDWNPSNLGGQKQLTQKNGQPYYYDFISSNPNLSYDPSSPSSIAYSGTTTDPDNGYDQYRWLLTSLAASKAKWKIITAHHPVYASGRWGDTQPDDHMSNPTLQRLLKALPAGSFDAFYNGHDHFYERVLESKSGGIGLGIPFITNGNSGRNLEAKMQMPYGTVIYNPPLSGYNTSKSTANPNQAALDAGALLLTDPILVGSSGLSGTPKGSASRYANGLYGYGFGAVKVDLNDDHLLFNFQEAPIVDPAIANHLSGGAAPEVGFQGTIATDWIPNPFSPLLDANTDIARFKLTINNGVVTGVTLLNQGNGYMSSRGGNAVVEGFNVYGNNVDLKQPWLNTAQVRLTFSGGRLTAVDLADGGRGYELAVMSAAENNTATSTESFSSSARDLVVPINYNLDESQYHVRDPQLYNDWYLITDTGASVQLHGLPGRPGFVSVKMMAKGEETRDLLTSYLQPTTGYSGQDSQSFSSFAQSGRFQLSQNARLIASGALQNGSWVGYVPSLPESTQDLSFRFDGDPITSYNINFKPSQGSTAANLSRLSRREVSAFKQQANFSTPVTFDSSMSAPLLGSSLFELPVQADRLLPSLA